MPNSSITITELNGNHNVKSFDCGNTALNVFLQQYAKQNRKNNISKTYVLTTETEILGFYTLSSGQISCVDLPKNNKHPRYPVAIARIARLAVHKNYHKQGYGGFLLFDALTKIKTASEIIGIHAVVVDAKDKPAKQFYQHYGFEPLQNKKLTLFLPMKTITKLF